MSVLMTLRVAGDSTAVETTDPETLKKVVARGKEFGCISHHFFGSDTEILVVDEWPDEASFQAFFAASPEIPELMAAAGVTSQPSIEMWRPLNTGDSLGW